MTQSNQSLPSIDEQYAPGPGETLRPTGQVFRATALETLRVKEAHKHDGTFERPETIDRLSDGAAVSIETDSLRQGLATAGDGIRERASAASSVRALDDAPAMMVSVDHGLVAGSFGRLWDLSGAPTNGLIALSASSAKPTAGGRDGLGSQMARALAGETSARLLFPADGWQMRACVRELIEHSGQHIVFTCDSPVPDLIDVNDELMYGPGYTFRVGVDDIVREGCDGFLISYGDALHQSLGVVERLYGEDISLGIINKPTLNVPDEEVFSRLLHSPSVLLVESLTPEMGLGERLRAWLDERGFSGTYDRIGPDSSGMGGPASLEARKLLDHVRRLFAPSVPALSARVLDRAALRAVARRYCALVGNERVEMTAPTTLGKLDPRLIPKVGPFIFPAPFAAELHEVRLMGPDAVGFMPDGRAVLETSVDRFDVLGRSLSRTAPQLHRTPTVDRLDLACSLVNHWSPQYAHWLLEGLTRLEALECYIKATGERPRLIIDGDAPTWKRESLRLMGVDPDECIQWQGGPVEVDRLVVCSKRRDQGRVSGRALRFVRECILNNLPPGPPPQPRRIWITRDDARFRQIVNEDELRTLLEPMGFTQVRLSGMPWPEQVRLFRDVEYVIAAHGAGLTNIMFAQKPPVVIELFGQKVSHMLFTLAQALGCDYRVLLCAPEGDHLRVDIDDLRRLMDTESRCVSVPGVAGQSPFLQ